MEELNKWTRLQTRKGGRREKKSKMHLFIFDTRVSQQTGERKTQGWKIVGGDGIVVWR